MHLLFHGLWWTHFNNTLICATKESHSHVARMTFTHTKTGVIILLLRYKLPASLLIVRAFQMQSIEMDQYFVMSLTLQSTLARPSDDSKTVYAMRNTCSLSDSTPFFFFTIFVTTLIVFVPSFYSYSYKTSTYRYLCMTMPLQNCNAKSSASAEIHVDQDSLHCTCQRKNNKQRKNKKKTKDFITINIERCQERIWQPLLLFHSLIDPVLVLVSTLLPSLIHAQCQLFTHAHIIETKKKHQTDSHGVVWAWSLNKSHRTNVYLVICWKAVFFAICLCYIVC